MVHPFCQAGAAAAQQAREPVRPQIVTGDAPASPLNATPWWVIFGGGILVGFMVDRLSLDRGA